MLRCLSRIATRILCISEALALICVSAPMAQDASVYQQGQPILLYTDEEMDVVEDKFSIRSGGYDPYIDQSFWAIKMPAGGLRFYHKSVQHQSYHEGSVKNKSFFQNVVYNPSLPTNNWRGTPANNPMKNLGRGNKTATPPAGWTFHYDGSGEFIPNVYQISSTELLGIVHIERTYTKTGSEGDRYYNIGIAYSNDVGMTWDYCGDVILPKINALGDFYQLPGHTTSRHLSNIGGIPYLITGQYLQVYFNESASYMERPYPSMARAPLQSVINSARNKTVVTADWKKYSGGTGFSEDGITGTGAKINGINVPGFTAGAADMHSDATYCFATGQFLMTVNYDTYTTTPFQYSIDLYSSYDAINWTREKTLIGPKSSAVPYYSSFISESAGSSNDDHIVGRQFYIIYGEKRIEGGVVKGETTDMYALPVCPGIFTPIDNLLTR